MLEVPRADGPGRIASLDQFRGATVVGMLAVNFLGGFAAVPAVLKHHNTYCSFADTIMPQFFFAVGFAYRLTFLRRLATVGPGAAYRHAIGRNLGLILLGVVFHGVDGSVANWEALRSLGFAGIVTQAFQRSAFQTLTHIGVTSLWVLPVIAAGSGTRLAFLALSAALHVGLSRAFYFDFAWGRPVIDGGPLGFLTWTAPLLAGSIAHDWLRGTRPLAKLGVGSIALMAVGYGLSCGVGDPSARWADLPFCPPTAPVDIWTMSQRTGSASYLLFASGFAMFVYLGFAVACDRLGAGVELFDLMGRQALAAYLIHPAVGSVVKKYTPKDAPGWYVLGAFLLYLAVSAAFVRHVDRRGVRL